MRGNPAADWTRLPEEVTLLVLGLGARYRAVFEPSDGMPTPGQCGDVAQWYLDCLSGKSGQFEGERAAREIVEHLCPVESLDAAWWGGSLGKAVAWWIGYREETVPQGTAARILGVSRQRITTLIKDNQIKWVSVEGAAPRIDRQAIIERLHRNA